jgi:hypothetical protein
MLAMQQLLSLLYHSIWIVVIILVACVTVERHWFADPTEPPAHPDDDEWW